MADRTKTPTKLTTHEKYVAQVRAEGLTATPYRIGLAVGAAGDNLPSPYPPGSRGDHNYLDGVEYGRGRRRSTTTARARTDYQFLELAQVLNARLGAEHADKGFFPDPSKANPGAH